MSPRPHQTEKNTSRDADLLHIGPVHYASSNISRVRKQEFHKSLERLVEFTIASDIDAIVQTGTLFATKSLTNDDAAKLRELLTRLTNADVQFVTVGGMRIREMDIVKALEDDGLIQRPATDPVVVDDVAIVGVEQPNKGDIASQLQLVSQPEVAASETLLALPTTVSPVVPEGNIRHSALRRALSFDPDGVLSGHRNELQPADGAPADDWWYSNVGPTELELRYHSLDSEIEYPCAARLHPGTARSAQVNLPHDSLKIVTVESGPELTLADLQSEIDPHDSRVLVHLRGVKTKDSVKKSDVYDWIAGQTTVAKLWDDREPASDVPTARQTTESSIRVDSLTADINSPRVAGSRQPVFSSDSRGTSPDDFLQPNAVTELYEALRCLKIVLNRVIRSDQTSVDIDDSSNPLVQYRLVVRALIGLDESTDEFVPYGDQQQERVPHSVQEYREAYGDGDWITEYQTIETAQFSEITQQQLEEHGLVDEASVLVRPVSEADIPIPEAPTTEAAFSRALSVLERLPAAPAVPWDTHQDDSLPITDLYQHLCEVHGFEQLPIDGLARDRQEPQSTDSTQLPEYLKTTPAALSSPSTQEEVDRFLQRHGKLTHLYQTIQPPAEIDLETTLPVFALDGYHLENKSDTTAQHKTLIKSFAKKDEETYEQHFVARMRDLLYRRILYAEEEFDFITVYPGHTKGSVSDALRTLAKKVTVETSIVYAQLIERTQTTGRQKHKSKQERWEIAMNPSTTLRARHRIDGSSVLLLDDVCTSGASLTAGAETLRGAGADQVVGLALGMTNSKDKSRATLLDERKQTISDLMGAEQ